jgi:GTP-binding protein LepA
VRFREAAVKKLVIYIMDEPIDALSFMVREDRAFEIGKSICIKLKDKINPELFVVSIQAKMGGKVEIT